MRLWRRSRDLAKPDPTLLNEETLDLSVNWYVQSISFPTPLPPEIFLPDSADQLDLISSYVPQAVLRRIGDVGVSRWLGDLRNISVLFVSLDLKNSLESSFFDALQAAMTVIQRELSRLEGTVRQFLVDDKGVVLIACFGLYPFAHEDDPVRAVTAALSIRSQLSEHQIDCSIGLTTGRAFCGAVGSTDRREYAVVGDIVNLSARLMGKANLSQTRILVDDATYKASRKAKVCAYVESLEIMVKGKKGPVLVWTPTKPLEDLPSTLDRVSTSQPGQRSERAMNASAVICRDEELRLLFDLVTWTQKKNHTESRFMLLDGELRWLP